MSVISKNSVVMKIYNNSKTINISQLQKQAVQQNANEIVEINKEQMRGSRSGNGLLPDYSPSTLGLKDFSNYRGMFPKFDLFDTGSFQDKMKGTVNGNEFETTSTDSKTDDLVSSLGNEIFELDQSSNKQAQMLVTPDFNKLAHNYLNK